MSRLHAHAAWQPSRIVCLSLSFLCLVVPLLAAAVSRADAVYGAGADVSVTVDTGADLGRVPPGVVGWGAMWKRDMLWPAPPAEFDDASHAAYVRHLGETLAPRVEDADMRNISWPWGVTFSTWAVNWENSAGPWSERVADCVRLLGRTSPWCETTVIGVGDLMTLAQMWELDAVTVSVPLAVVDGSTPRWGPHFFNHDFPDAVIEQVADHARRLIDTMKRHPGWDGLKRIYLAAGTEWRHYKLQNPSPAVLTYARLIRRIREVIGDDKVVVVASASDSADIAGIPQVQAAGWNRYLYEELHDVHGVALDLHRYRGAEGLAAAADGSTSLDAGNIDRLLGVGLRQRDYLRVHPGHWGGEGSAARTVLLENAIHGLVADHATRSTAARPWVVSMAHADLVREALRSGSLTFLGWTWFPEDLPAEWPHGALDANGVLQPHARAQAFLSLYHRGRMVSAQWSSEASLRGNATRNRNGVTRLYGGNFSRSAMSLGLTVLGTTPSRVRVEIMEEGEVRRVRWDGSAPLEVPAMALFRIRMRP